MWQYDVPTSLLCNWDDEVEQDRSIDRSIDRSMSDSISHSIVCHQQAARTESENASRHYTTLHYAALHCTALKCAMTENAAPYG
jgi:hypothetical protein